MLMASISGFCQVSRQNALKPQRLVPHGWGGATISGGLARELTEPAGESITDLRKRLDVSEETRRDLERTIVALLNGKKPAPEDLKLVKVRGQINASANQE